MHYIMLVAICTDVMDSGMLQKYSSLSTTTTYPTVRGVGEGGEVLGKSLVKLIKESTGL